MKVVGIRELKNRLSEYIRRVRAGEEVLVTDRGEVVAEMLPPRRRTADPAAPPELEPLVRDGTVTPATAAGPARYHVLPPLLPEGEAARLLDEEREDR